MAGGFGITGWHRSEGATTPTVYMLRLNSTRLFALQVRFDAVTAESKPWETNVMDPIKALTTDGINFYGAMAGSGGGRVVAWSPSGRQLWRVGGNGDAQ